MKNRDYYNALSAKGFPRQRRNGPWLEACGNVDDFWDICVTKAEERKWDNPSISIVSNICRQRAAMGRLANYRFMYDKRRLDEPFTEGMLTHLNPLKARELKIHKGEKFMFDDAEAKTADFPETTRIMTMEPVSTTISVTVRPPTNIKFEGKDILGTLATVFEKNALGWIVEDEWQSHTPYKMFVLMDSRDNILYRSDEKTSVPSDLLEDESGFVVLRDPLVEENSND